jgi:hypothetical protein
MPFKTNATYFDDHGRNHIPDHVKQSPEYKPFFDGIAVILAALKIQNSRVTKAVALPTGIDMSAASNYGITIKEWWDHNFASNYGITIRWI